MEKAYLDKRLDIICDYDSESSDEEPKKKKKKKKKSKKRSRDDSSDSDSEDDRSQLDKDLDKVDPNNLKELGKSMGVSADRVLRMLTESVILNCEFVHPGLHGWYDEIRLNPAYVETSPQGYQELADDLGFGNVRVPAYYLMFSAIAMSGIGRIKEHSKNGKVHTKKTEVLVPIPEGHMLVDPNVLQAERDRNIANGSLRVEKAPIIPVVQPYVVPPVIPPQIV